jgi:hypothetical protein
VGIAAPGCPASAVRWLAAHGTFLQSATYNNPEEIKEVSAMFTFLLWCMLFVLCWPLALLALIAYPFIWLLLLPFRIIGVAVHGVLELIFLAITLPFRLLAAPFRV